MGSILFGIKERKRKRERKKKEKKTKGRERERNKKERKNVGCLFCPTSYLWNDDDDDDEQETKHNEGLKQFFSITGGLKTYTLLQTRSMC